MEDPGILIRRNAEARNERRRMNDPEQLKRSTKSKARLGIIAGAIAAPAVTWSVYLVEKVSIHFVSLATHSFCRGLWDVVSFPGLLLAEVLGQDVYGFESDELTISGVSLITLANGILFSAAAGAGGALLDRRA